jgi:hypothetical protein
VEKVYLMIINGLDAVLLFFIYYKNSIHKSKNRSRLNFSIFDQFSFILEFQDSTATNFLGLWFFLE